MKKKIILSIIITTIYLVVLIICGLDNNPEITEYNVYSEQITEHIKICFLTDYHSSEYDNKLFELINKSVPDVVLLGGDFFDETRSDIYTIKLLDFLSESYICYFVTGNHEYWCGEELFNSNMEILDAYGIKRLSGETVILNIKGNFINLCGVDDPANQLFEIKNTPEKEFESQIEKISTESDNGNFTILLSHRPEYISKYTSKGFDLILSGHAHGGQVRIPGILNGIYAPGQGLFPEYTSGEYYVDGTEMIVSRGLSKGKETIPRFFNRPEIVVINLLPVTDSIDKD